MWQLSALKQVPPPLKPTAFSLTCRSPKLQVLLLRAQLSSLARLETGFLQSVMLLLSVFLTLQREKFRRAGLLDVLGLLLMADMTWLSINAQPGGGVGVHQCRCFERPQSMYPWFQDPMDSPVPIRRMRMVLLPVQSRWESGIGQCLNLTPEILAKTGLESDSKRKIQISGC